MKTEPFELNMSVRFLTFPLIQQETGPLCRDQPVFRHEAVRLIQVCSARAAQRLKVWKILFRT